MTSVMSTFGLLLFAFVFFSAGAVAALFGSYWRANLRETPLTQEAEAWCAEARAVVFARHQLEQRLQALEALAFAPMQDRAHGDDDKVPPPAAHPSHSEMRSLGAAVRQKASVEAGPTSSAELS